MTGDELLSPALPSKTLHASTATMTMAITLITQPAALTAARVEEMVSVAVARKSGDESGATGESRFEAKRSRKGEEHA